MFLCKMAPLAWFKSFPWRFASSWLALRQPQILNAILLRHHRNCFALGHGNCPDLNSNGDEIKLDDFFS